MFKLLTRGNNIECTIWVLAVIFLTVSVIFYYYFTVIATLQSQSEKEERRNNYSKKVKNRIQSDRRRALAKANQTKTQRETKRCRGNKFQSHLDSQSGLEKQSVPHPTSPSFDYYYNHVMNYLSEKRLDALQSVWTSFHTFSPRSLDLNSFLSDAISSSKSLIKDLNIPTDWFTDFDFGNNMKFLMQLRTCKLTKMLCRIFNMLTTLGWLEAIDFKFGGVTIFKTSPLRGSVTIMDILEVIGQLIKTFLKCLANFPTKGIMSFFDDAVIGQYEIDYTWLTSMKVLVDTGHSTSCDPKLFDRKLAELINLTEELLGSCDSFEKTYYVSKLKELKNIQSSRTLCKRDFIRMKPYGLLLYGGSAVGKSAMSNAIIRYMLAANSFDSSPRAIITLNEFDKFQSEYRTHHGGVIFDDLCNGTVKQTDGNPLMKIIQFINNAPQAALNPNVEMKGNVMIEPNVVLATTNVKDLMASEYTNEPLSVARRFNTTVTQTVKPEFCKTGTKMLDSSKVRAVYGDAAYPDCYLFTIETAITKAGNITTGKQKTEQVVFQVIEFEGKPLFEVGILTLLKFLRADSLNHFTEQSHFVAAQRANKEICLCEHHLPVTLCEECIFESETGNLNQALEFVQKYEERIVVFMQNLLRSFYLTKFGQILLTYLYRDVLKTIVWTTLPVFGLLTWTCFLIEWLGQYRGLTWFFFGTMCICAYIATRFYYIRKNVLTKWSTIPRPTVWFRSLSWSMQIKIFAAFGGMTTLMFIKKILNYRSTFSNSEASDPIFMKADGVARATTEFWDEQHREKALSFNPKMEAGARTSTHEQLITIVEKRLMMVHVGEPGSSTFCDCMPMKGNILLIPNHIVPKVTTPARITKANANPKNIVITPESCFNIPGTDFALWYLPELGDQKDITDYLPAKITKGKSFTGTLVYNDHGAIKKFPPMLCTRSRTTSTEGGTFESIKYSFPGKTFNGLCMATFVAEDSKSLPFIAGFHLAGRDCVGAAGFLTKEQVLSGITSLSERPSVLPSHSAQPFRTTIADIDVGPLTKPHAMCVSNELTTDAKCNIFGTHTQPRATPTSSVIVSMISDKVTEICGLPRMHDQPHKLRDIVHKQVDIAGKTDTAFLFNGDSIDLAVTDFQSSIFDSLSKKDIQLVGKLSNDAVVAGYDGVQGVNAMALNTSMGFPFKGPKTGFFKVSDRYVEGISCPRDVDNVVLEEMAYLESELKAGRRINAVFKAALKDEPTKIGKKKARVFAGCNSAFTMVVRKYYLTPSALMQKKKSTFECAVGLNVEAPEWTTLMDDIYKFGKDRVVAGDYKAFDGRMSPRFMLAAFKILIEIAKESGNYDEEDITVMTGIATEICSPTYDYFGTLIQFFGSNPSGHPLTVVINSLVNSLYMRYVYFEIAKQDKWWRVPRFNKVVSLMTYGDDNIMSVKEGFDAYNHTRIASVLAECGIIYTMADKEAESVPFINGSEAGFLKHEAIWDEDMQLYRARIDEHSICKMLHAHKQSSSITEEMHCSFSIKDAMDKYFHYGREVYEKRHAQLTQVARETNILGLVGELKSYDTQLSEYALKYAWDANPTN